MKYLRVQCTPNLASACIGCVRYRNIHAEGAYCTLPLNVLKDCLVVLQSISIFFAFSKNDFLLGYHRHSHGLFFRQIATFAEVENCLQSSLLEEAVGFLATDGWIPGSFEGSRNLTHGRNFPDFFSPFKEATEKPYISGIVCIENICTCKVKINVEQK